MGSVNAVFIGLPIFVMIVMQMMFGNPDNSLVQADFNLLTSVIGSASSRDECNANYSQCSNDNCFIIDPDGILGSANGFPCGDTFYVLLIIGVIIATPFLALGIPILLMAPLTEITFFSAVYTFADFWFVYAPMWGFFGIGIAGVIW